MPAKSWDINSGVIRIEIDSVVTSTVLTQIAHVDAAPMETGEEWQVLIVLKSHAITLAAQLFKRIIKNLPEAVARSIVLAVALELRSGEKREEAD